MKFYQIKLFNQTDRTYVWITQHFEIGQLRLSLRDSFSLSQLYHYNIEDELSKHICLWTIIEKDWDIYLNLNFLQFSIKKKKIALWLK
jgi:hypothetical protein